MRKAQRALFALLGWGCLASLALAEAGGNSGTQPQEAQPASTSSAQAPSGGASSLLERLDRNGDRTLTLEEIPPQMERLHRVFPNLDKDGDGRLSSGEMEGIRGAGQPSQRPAGASSLLGRLDQNGDGSLSREEIPPQMTRLNQGFDRLDRDGNGYLSLEELEGARMQSP